LSKSRLSAIHCFRLKGLRMAMGTEVYTVKLRTFSGLYLPANGPVWS
jgi:hypothetical protein